ncbi:MULTISPECIES: fibronectin type III domain-containing protein [unclassified Lentimicrobium]|uniref:fibronectin type III domain-containing protein n=1 Tax=unclassified Lentimicrobium TaxID=2677434 RepID=UPI001551816D|nr:MULTISPECIES: fibronectin type III domain-containing protein [unclassified Lentimicrobium]NPD48082.1 fibronectin type III domain-containing protein [Lentimicrobium sp. S6]NPD86945.1 fibronectin type III domain-containing protein [Lentimicrobium sp. L6]
MKRFLLFSSLILLLFSCNEKEEVSHIDQALVPGVTQFEGRRDHTGIHLTWSYAYASSLNYFILYYSPGGEDTDTISAFESNYTVHQVQSDTNYIFHLKAIDKMGNSSERAVLRMSTY